MARESIEFVKFLVGMRGPRTSLTASETALICELAENRQSVVEVGVFEGATSQRIARVLHEDGLLYLVDPFGHHTRIERLLGFSSANVIAHRSLSAYQERARFVRMSSLDAASRIELHRPADLVFIDADHSYDAVKGDFYAWIPHLANGGLIAFHDSRLSPIRPDLSADTGSVRFADEIRSGGVGSWVLVQAADTLSVFQRK